MSSDTRNLVLDTQKYNVIKQGVKKAPTKSVQTGYVNYAYPSMVDKAHAFSIASLFDADEEFSEIMFEAMLDEIKLNDGLGVMNFMFYLQAIAVGMNELFLRACRNLMEALKPKPKQKEDKSQWADPFTAEDYKDNYDYGKKHFDKVKKDKRYKQFELSYSKDRKGQSDLIKEERAKKSQLVSDNTTIKVRKASEKTRSDFGMKLSQQSLKGKGGSASYAWGGDGGDSFFAPTPQFDNGYCMEM